MSNNPNLQINIGIIGGGQLGRMMAQSAKEAGYRVIILDPTEDCPAAQVADEQLVASFQDKEALETLSQKATIITYEFENIDCETIEETLSSEQFPQRTDLLRISQNRLFEKNYLVKNGFPVADYFPVRSSDELNQAIDRLSFPCVLKTTRFGYDGKGQIILRSKDDLDSAKKMAQETECVLEQWLPFVKEVSIMISRNHNGDVSLFPVSENVHVHHILHESIIPARISENIEKKVATIATDLANQVQLVGTLGIECFLMEDETVYINELAPRPHNSGHFSIEACNFSQFDTSILAVLNRPLPSIELLKPAVMVNVLGQHVEGVQKLRNQKSNWHFHDYGKEAAKPNRKMGHITILTDDIEKTLREIEQTNLWKEG